MKNELPCIALITGGHALSHFAQLALPPLFPLIRAELGISYVMLGFVIMLPSIASAVLQPLAGFLVDRIGGRDVLIGGVAVLGVGILIMSLAQGPVTLALGALVMGIGNSVFHPADFSILNGRVSVPRLGYAFSAHSVAGSLGFAAAPLFAAGIASVYGWHGALTAVAGVGFAFLIVLLACAHHLHVPTAPRKSDLAADMRVLRSPGVLLCFLFFVLWGASTAGLANFSISAMQIQFEVDVLLASAAVTAYMVGNAAGMLAGGFVAVRVVHHDIVAASGLAFAALIVLLIAFGTFPGGVLPLALCVAGTAAGITNPSRDLIVRASTPPGAAGRVYGFVYSGLDVGAFSTPMFYGMLIDHGMPQGVFYAVFAFIAVATLTVLQLPGKKLAIQRT
jgi:MFS family permease